MMTQPHKRIAQILIALALTLGFGCTSTTVGPLPASDRFPINPRLGWKPPVSAWTARKYERAWTALLAGRIEAATQDLRSQANEFPPAALALAAVAIDQGDFETAQEQIDSALATDAEWIAANALNAELNAKRGDLGAAQRIYAELVARPGAAASVRDRERTITTALFEDLTSRAANTKDHTVAIDLLRRAVAIRPDASSARLLLVDRIVEAKRFDEARKELDPLIATNPLDPKVQMALVEIDVGKGRYQEAISRLDTLNRQHPDRANQERLAEIKRLWNDTNLPSQYHRALASAAITREDLAVLVYWKILPVRFATDLPEPPIAVDIETTRGREELIRALSLRLFTVDPVTREAHPSWTVPPSTFMRALSTVVVWLKAPCTRGASDGRPATVLAACGLDVSAIGDESVSGANAAALLETLARQIGASRE